MAQYDKPRLKNNNVVIYLDMDGVLCDFTKKAKTIYEDFDTLTAMWRKGDTKNQVYKAMNKEFVQRIVDTPNFWAELEWMEFGKDLYEFVISRFDRVDILTAPIWQDQDRCSRQKRAWCNRNLSEWPNHHFYLEGDKVKVLERTAMIGNDVHVLIDDKKKNIERWETFNDDIPGPVRAHGIHYHHDSYIDVIGHLSDLYRGSL